MSGRGDDACWRTEEERRADEESWMKARGFSVPSFTGGTMREEIVGDFFKPEVDEVDSRATGFGPMRTENQPVTSCHELRGSVLQEAIHTINGQRQDSYGNPEDSFERIANLWDAYLTGKYRSEIDLTAEDVALMMTLMKIVRMMTGSGHRDSYIDAAGYIGLAADMGAK